MGVFSSLLDMLSGRKGKTPQGETISPSYSDFRLKDQSFSVESEISEALADLMLMYSQFPIVGENERALWLDNTSDEFMRNTAKSAIVTGFATGDCLIVPSWNGRNIQNMIVPADAFDIYEFAGDEILSCGYVLETYVKNNQTYYLMQSIDLEKRATSTGEDVFSNVYRTFVATQGGIIEDISQFPQWRDKYTAEWVVPNVEQLLIARFKSHTYNPNNLNNVKGAPITLGASAPIREIHYLLSQMHEEFELSEKMVMASKKMFERTDDGHIDIPRGKRRVFFQVKGGVKSDEPFVEDWAPDIRYKAYLEAIDKQEQLVERAVGVSSGIISCVNEMNYQNVDNVRKSQQKTMGFISEARKQAEIMLSQLVYAWNMLANFYEVTPYGEYEPVYDWSSEWIETFADKENAILAGRDWATDAVDYRMFLYNESPEVAREKVEEIQSQAMANYQNYFSEGEEIVV